MWTLNFLRRRVSDARPVAIPLAVAVVIHAVVIAVSSWRGRQAAAAAQAPSIVDNTRQLIRLSRRLRQQDPLVPSAMLSLSDKLPPPPPDLLKVAPATEGEEANRCDSKTVGAARAVPATSAEGDSQATRSSSPVPSPESISALWSQATPVLAWPQVFGPIPEGVQVRRFALTAFPGLSAKQLHKLTLTSASDQFLVRANDQAVWVARRSLE